MKLNFIVLLIAISLASCADYEKGEQPPKTLTTEIDIVQNETGEYAMNFQDEKEWKMSVASSAEELDWNTLVPVKDYQQNPKATTSRQFFGFVNKEGDSLVFSNKKIMLEGAHNFRDLGGMKTEDGKRVKFGMIYRADKLSEITENDVEKLQNLGIKTICDLRTTSETTEEPDNIPSNASFAYFHLPVGKDSLMGGGGEKEMIKEIKKFDAEKSAAFMAEATRDFAVKFKDSYKSLYQKLNKNETPLVYHCTAGKDRTGVASALLLDVLGVSKEDIYADYLMSNYYRYAEYEEMLEKAAVYGIDHTTLRPFMEVRESYLDEAYAQINKEYSSVENYFIEGLGFTQDDLEKLRRLLLY